MIRIFIKDGTIFDPGRNYQQKINLVIINSKIESFTSNNNIPADIIINAENKIIIPGMIDLHVHLRDPGQTYKEDLTSGTLAAVHGGFTSILCMPNTNPILDTPQLITKLIERSKKEAYSNVFPIGAITRKSKGEVLTDFASLKDAGAVALSDDGRVVQNANLMYEALKKAKKLSLPLSQHAEDSSLSKDTVINYGEISKKLGVKGDPDVSESIIVARDILLAAKTGGHIHVEHISTETAVSLVRKAKKLGINLTAEVTPHHLILTEDWVLKEGANAKMRPPLRKKKDVLALQEALADGTIDCIATDHAPHSHKDKAGQLKEAANGIIGLETAFGLIFTCLVKPGIIDLKTAIAAFTSKPAAIVGLDKGSIASGKDADITIIDLEQDWAVNPDDFFSKSRNTPFSGWNLSGKPVLTMVGGKIVWHEKSFPIEVNNVD